MKHYLTSALLLALMIICITEPVSWAKSPRMSESERANFEAFLKHWTEADICWKRTATRGVGTIPTRCRSGQEKNGLLCYPSCPSGMYGVGPVCWQTCPNGYSDDGALCRRDAKIVSADNSQCPWYDKCGLTFARNCSKCPNGYINDGCTCRINVDIVAKRTQGRGAGVGMSCGPAQDYDAGLCYNKCPAGTSGVGPVCWGECPADFPVSCAAGCAKSSEACANSIMQQIESSTDLVLNVAALISGAGAPAKAAVNAAKNTAEQTGKSIISREARQAAIRAVRQKLQEQAREEGKDLSDEALDHAAEMLQRAKEAGEFDWTVLDPTGVSAVVMAFYKPICGG